MTNDRTEEFLDLYKQLEQTLKLNYSSDSGHYESVVARFENSPACGNMQDELRMIRDIRNLLQHNPKINGRYIAEPSEDIMNAMKKVLQMAASPKLAIDFGIKESQIYKAQLGSSLMPVLKVMQERGFTHVPIMENGILFGVLSAYTIIEFIAQQGLAVLSETTKIKALRDYIPIGKHKNEYFLFMSKDATFTDADEAFEKRDKKGRRLVVIFITEHGQQDEPLLAMLTPWSVVGK